ncbi:MAG: fibronectin type III domain-containing protein [Bacillus sp. (in: Bacteria)]|nr:fibronectin type III domain-containing protein [Bacillus sp. (in: firmicutes)]
MEKKVYGQFSPIVSAKTRLGKTDAVQAKPSDFNKITVSWSRVAGATGYEIYRSGSRSGTYSRVRTVTSGSTLSFVNGSLDTGKTYYYKVRAFREVNGVKIYGPYSSIVHGKPVLDKTISVKGSSADFNKINISWARTSGANGYEVYRSTSKSGTYSRVRTITNGSTLSFENGNLETERTYYYKVRAYRNVNDKKVFGPFSSTINVKAILARPGNVKGQRVSASSMELSWSRVNGANGYEIFRATSSTGSYSRVGRVTNGSTVKYVDKGLMKGRTFYYKVRAYRDVNGKRVFSTYSSVFTYRVP